ncbi:MAG: formyltransferase family protein [Acidobacteriota bacterium]|nr:formyltransferase family protein [Acidobacteriota bacterium]
MMHKDKARARILFFGRSKCEASKKILSQMHRNGFDVTYVKSNHRGESLPEDVQSWDGDYIICFRSHFILPDSLLKKARIAAINFHPAPPEYPGSGCMNFALYDGVDTYGVTAHLMNEKVDNGKILEVRRFPVQKCDNLPSVLERTHSELYHLCSDFVTALATVGESYVPAKVAECEGVSWSGKARLLEELEKLQTIDVGIEKSELERIIRATHVDGFPPKVMLHGYKFYLSLDE